MTRWQRQGYERGWVDTAWRALGLARLQQAVAHWWLWHLPGPVPYLLQPGYGWRYQVLRWKSSLALWLMEEVWKARWWRQNVPHVLFREWACLRVALWCDPDYVCQVEVR